MTDLAPEQTGWKRALGRADAKLAKAEQIAAAACCVLLCLLIGANVVVRALRIPVYWIDEVAVFAMVWMVFLASASAVQSSEHVVVDLLARKLSRRWQSVCARVSSVVMLLVGLACLACAFLWFDPLSLIRAGGDVSVFSDRTLNFIYTEPTASFAAPKALFWLIMPYFSLSLTVHACVKLIQPAIPFTSPQEEGI